MNDLLQALREENRNLRRAIDELQRGVFAPFYLVWSPEGLRPPTVKHLAQKNADDEARRLAAEKQPCEFFVLKSVARAHKTGPLLLADNYDEIPF